MNVNNKYVCSVGLVSQRWKKFCLSKKGMIFTLKFFKKLTCCLWTPLNHCLQIYSWQCYDKTPHASAAPGAYEWRLSLQLWQKHDWKGSRSSRIWLRKKITTSRNILSVYTQNETQSKKYWDIETVKAEKSSKISQ